MTQFKFDDIKMKPTSNTLKGKRIIGKPIHSAKGEHKMEPLIKISNDKFAEIGRAHV